MKIIAFDIETGSVDDLHSYGPGYVRLCGWSEVGEGAPVTISTDPAELLAVLNEAHAITGHNIINFDLMALAKWHGADYEALCKKSFDTMVVERHLNPVAAKGAQPTGYYGLDQTAARYGVGGKSHVDFEGKLDIVRRVKGDAHADRMAKARQRLIAKTVGQELDADLDYDRYLASGDTERAHAIKSAVEARIQDRMRPAPVGVLKLLAELYGGYDAIPQDDPDYSLYLRRDVEASAGLFRVMQEAVKAEPVDSKRYIRREHYVSTAMGRITLEGMRSDTDLTMSRWAAGEARLQAGKDLMAERYGMPVEGKKPHTTNAGKAAVRAAMLSALRCTDGQLDANWPLNKDGSLSTSKDVLNAMIERFDTLRPEAAELCRVILAMNGERTIYGTLLHHLVGDRVHPYIGPDQSSGRWSMKNPGLTVFGKRGGKARERAVMLADEGDVLVAIDADQIDARMIAALSQDPEYMKLFAPGVDLHSEVAFRVWPIDRHGPDCHRLDEWHSHDCGIRNKCHCEYRDRAKVFGHGWNYGMGPNSMARNHGVDVSVAQQFDRGMQDGFPVLCRWKEEVRQAAGVLGFGEEAPVGDEYRILHTAFGRPVRVERNRAYTQACAQLGQGSTRDGMAEAILKLSPFYRRRIRAVIHDEIVVSIPDEGDAQAVAQSLADSMGFDFKGIRISFGCSRVAKSWAGCYGAEYEEVA